MSLFSTIARRVGLVPATELHAAQELAVNFGNIAAKYRAEASGVKLNSGHFDYELNQKLKGAARWPNLAAMNDSDPHVKGGLRFNMLPLVAGPWSMVSASDKAKDRDVAEFCGASFLGLTTDKYGPEYKQRQSWRQNLYERLQMLPDGFSMFAKKWKVVPGLRGVGPKIVLDRLTWLEPETVDPSGWILDDEDNIVAVKRTFRYASGRMDLQKPIPADRIVLNIHELKGARYEGSPFTRSTWGAYYRKDLMLKWATVAAQKLGSPAPYATYPTGTQYSVGSDVLEVLKSFVQQLRGESPTDAYAVLPQNTEGNGPEIKYAGSDVGELDRFRGLINGENAEIAHALGTKSMLLGETDSGSRALGQSLSAIELLYLNATAVGIAEFMNDGVANLEGEIAETCRYNFSDVRETPRIQCDRVHPDQGLERIPIVLQCVAAGITPRTPELMKQITEAMGYNLPDDAYVVQELAPEVTPGDNPEPDADEEDPTDKSAALPMSCEEVQRRIVPLMADAYTEKPPGKRRAVNKFEDQYMNLAAMQASFDNGEKRAADVLRRMRAAMVDEIVRRVSAGKVSPGSLGSQRESKSKVAPKFASELRALLIRTADEGGGHIREEVARQRGRAV